MAVQAKVNVAPVWLKRLYRDLSETELQAIREALGAIPMEPDFGDVETLLERAKAGDIGFYTLPGENGSAAITFYELQEYPSGKLNFHSIATVAIGGVATRSLVKADFGIMESMARQAGCSSMSLGTVRHGLCAVLIEKHGWRASEIIMRKDL